MPPRTSRPLPGRWRRPPHSPRTAGAPRTSTPTSGSRGSSPREPQPPRRTRRPRALGDDLGRLHPPPAKAALQRDEPQQPDEAQDDRDEEVQAQAEDVVGVVDALGLLEDPKARIAGHVEREQARRPDLAPRPQPHQEGGERQVPDELVEEGRLE